MKTAIGYFRESGLVERWAWFGAFPDLAGYVILPMNGTRLTIQKG